MKDQTFEEKLMRIEEIINLLEENKEPLEKSTLLYEEAMQLINTCEVELTQTEEKINKISIKP